MSDSLSRDECLKIFGEHGYSEETIINMIVLVLGAKTSAVIELKNLPNKAYLDTNLNIVYQNGRRYGKLEKAIKAFASM